MNEISQVRIPETEIRQPYLYEPLPFKELMVDSRSLNYFILKRLFDLALAIPTAIFLTPIMISIVLLIKIFDRGPAIFKQRRIGLGGQDFYCYKFRTMTVDAEERIRALIETDSQAAEEWARDQKLKNDPRITPLGKFLRKSSLDELPQIWNIIKGEMSFVGPRPIVHDEIKKYGNQYIAYVSVPPGITGLWQVSGRNDVEYEERVQLDAQYAHTRKIWNDIGILFKTIPAILFSKGAY